MQDFFPRIVDSGDHHYLIHKVAAVWIDNKDGFLRFKYENGRGKELLQGPVYLARILGEQPLATKELAQNRLQSPDEVNYVIAYHCGSFPYGMPEYLLRSLDDIPAEFLKK